MAGYKLRRDEPAGQASKAGMTLSSTKGTKWQRELEPIPRGWGLSRPLHREEVCGEEGDSVPGHGGGGRGRATVKLLGDGPETSHWGHRPLSPGWMSLPVRSAARLAHPPGLGSTRHAP